MIQYGSLILILIGIYGLLSQKNVIKLIVALNILEIGVNLFIISVAYISDANAPIITKNITDNFVDPLPHALVLTAIVIGVGITAVALSFAKKMYAKYGTYDLEKMEVER